MKTVEVTVTVMVDDGLSNEDARELVGSAVAEVLASDQSLLDVELSCVSYNVSPTPDQYDQTPLVWNPLWEAMRDTPDQWIATTKEMFDAMRGCVPPLRMSYGAFLVGEADHTNVTGAQVYACFKMVGLDRVEARYMTLAEFNTLFCS